MKTMTTAPTPPDKPFFVALDVPAAGQAVALAELLRPHVGGFKIGLELFCGAGPAVVEQIGAEQVFLDLKFHDIPHTVRGAARVAAGLGVMIFNVHCLGGLDMMRAAAEAARADNPAVAVIGVTILTSHDVASLAALGLHDEPAAAVRRLALLARQAGLDGVVCSAHEIEAVRAECDAEFLLVVPGIRPAGSDVGDQKRIMTPGQALAAGADWLVVGRPITAAPDPVSAARNLFV
jgi:orotidine-5'-phosphate decarboxylase